MKKITLLTLLCVLFASLVIMTACAEKTPGGDETASDTELTSGDVTEPTSDEADTTETGTGGESDTIPSVNEDVTAIPRYDYFTADVSKDVTLDKAKYSEIKLTLPSSLLVSDEQVMAYITQTIFQYRTPDNGSEQVTDQPLKKGDSAFIWYKGSVDGVEFSGGSNWDDETPFELGIGSGSFIPGFEDGLVGVVPQNATKETPFDLYVTFPEDYDNADLKGKRALFKIAIAYSVQYTAPEYTRDFVENTLLYEAKEKTYPSDAAFFAEYEAYIRAQLEAQNAESVEYAKQDAMWTYLTSTFECRNLNQDELDFYYNSYVSEIEYYYSQYSYYYGESFTTVYPDAGSFAVWYMGLDASKNWEDELHHMAELMVKKDMITHAIGEAEGMESVTDEEYQAEVAYWVAEYQGYMTEAEIIQSMGELYLHESAFSNKMAKWLAEKCVFTYE